VAPNGAAAREVAPLRIAPILGPFTSGNLWPSMQALWPTDGFTGETPCCRHASACQSEATMPVDPSVGPSGRGLSGAAALLSCLARVGPFPAHDASQQHPTDSRRELAYWARDCR